MDETSSSVKRGVFQTSRHSRKSVCNQNRPPQNQQCDEWIADVLDSRAMRKRSLSP